MFFLFISPLWTGFTKIMLCHKHQDLFKIVFDMFDNIIMENPVICIKVTGRHWKYLLLCCFKNNFIFYFRAPKICKFCQLNYFVMTMR